MFVGDKQGRPLFVHRALATTVTGPAGVAVIGTSGVVAAGAFGVVATVTFFVATNTTVASAAAFLLTLPSTVPRAVVAREYTRDRL